MSAPVYLLPTLPSSSNPSRLSATPLSVLLSGPPAAIISPPPQHIFFPSISYTSKIFYPYTPTHPLNIYLTPLYFYLSIYLLLLTFSLLSLSLTLCLSLFLIKLLVSRSLNHFITIYYLNIHSITICSLYLYFLTIFLTHTIYLLSPGPLPTPYLLCPTTK